MMSDTGNDNLSRYPRQTVFRDFGPAGQRGGTGAHRGTLGTHGHRDHARDRHRHLDGTRTPIGPEDQGLGVKRVEGAEVASTMHKGPFDQVGATYDALAGWIMENGYEIVWPCEEVYLSDPEKTPPEELLTELRHLVRKR